MAKKIDCGGFALDNTLDIKDGVLGVVGLTDKSIILASSTASSTKKFAITVLDDGTVKATEVE